VRLLAIAAHADDEALLCGGTLHKLARRGHECTVAFCTWNEQASGEEDAAARHTRVEAEAAASAARLGFAVRFLGFEDMMLADQPGCLLRALIDVIRELRPEVVVSHAPRDWHMDHRTLGAVVPEAALQSGFAVAGGSPWRPAVVLQGEVDLEGLSAFSYHLVSRLGDADLQAKLDAVALYNAIGSDHAVSMPRLRSSLTERAAVRGRGIGADAGEAFALSPLLPLDAAGAGLLAEVLA
jgi:LmbE family N-acetylglucosaminyl deacetylase